MKVYYVLLALLFSLGTKAQFQGNGTKNDPYLVEDGRAFEQFIKRNKNLEGVYFKLIANISTDNMGDFNGVLDGAGHEIDVNINYGSHSPKYISTQSLFIKIGNNALIQNLGVKNCNSLCFENEGIIRNCFVEIIKIKRTGSGFVDVRDGNSGVCKVNKGLIENCYVCGIFGGEENHNKPFYIQDEYEISYPGSYYPLNTYRWSQGEICQYNKGKISNCYSTVKKAYDSYFSFSFCIENKGEIYGSYGLVQKVSPVPLEEWIPKKDWFAGGKEDSIYLEESYKLLRELENLYSRVTKEELVALMNKNLNPDIWEKFSYNEHTDEISYPKLKLISSDKPTSIENVKDGINVYAANGSLFVQTSQMELVTIISISGKLVSNVNQIGFQQYELPQDIYIVKVGKKIFKISNR